MKYIVRTVHYQISSPFCSWSLDATQDAELFSRAQQDTASLVSISEQITYDCDEARFLMENNKVFLRSYIMSSVSSVLKVGPNFACQLGIIYITEIDEDGNASIVDFYVKRPEFSVEQLAKDLFCDFMNKSHAALGSLRYDDLPYPNMLEKFVASCVHWWDTHDHFSYASRIDVINACRAEGVRNNLQLFEC